MGTEEEKPKEIPEKGLARALRQRDQHNKEMRERLAEIEDEAELEEAEAEEFMELLTATEPTERTTKEVELPGGVVLTVYEDLTGEQEELMGMINTVALQAKRRIIPDMAQAIDAAVDLAASVVVPEEGRSWHTPEIWRMYHRRRDTAKLMEVVGILLEPYKKRCKKMAKFRVDKGRKKSGRSV